MQKWVNVMRRRGFEWDEIYANSKEKLSFGRDEKYQSIDQWTLVMNRIEINLNDKEI